MVRESYRNSSKCDGHAKTLTVIKSEHNQVFGGFTKQTWNGDNEWKKDPTAFIFSITKQTKFKVKKDSNYAIFCHPICGTIFGNDICILEYCETDSKSYSNFGNSYTLPNGMEYASKEARSYLAGSNHFKVSEIEVFKVIDN